ncbi:MAG TPA: hypothetical protein VFS56_12365 [Gemmatimonadaceae bacterium]|nr:hypothetical protein [Gemmatimonadaceae bacterium]
MRNFVISAVTLLVGAACAALPRMEPTLLERDWSRTRAETRRNVEAGNYHAADRLLAEFARVHPDTREARETAFWRGAYLVDPANTLGSLSGGIAALDGYLASEPNGWYRNEAEVLRRTAIAAQGLAAGASRNWIDTVVIVTPARDSDPPRRRSRDEEIAELRSQLARSKTELAEAQAELDRIKKRLANPSP